jgi:hypothetical protein
MLPVFMDMFIPAWKPGKGDGKANRRAGADKMTLLWGLGYVTTTELIDANQADVIICDHFSEGCLDAAISKDIPLVLTSTLAMYPGKKERHHIL